MSAVKIRSSLLAATLLAVFTVAPATVNAATLELWPERSTTAVGELVNVRLLVSNPGEALNAIQGTIAFPADVLTLVSISKEGSVLTLWMQDPTFSNVAGTAEFSGVVPNPGYSGGERKVLVLQFRTKKAGSASVRLTSAQVLANDGQGRDILTSTIPAALTINASVAPPTAAPTNIPAPVEESPLKEPVEPIFTVVSQYVTPPWQERMLWIVREAQIPLWYLLVYAGASALLIGFLLLHIHGFRMHVYRVTPMIKGPRVPKKTQSDSL